MDKFPKHGTDAEKQAWWDIHFEIVPPNMQDIEIAKKSFERYYERQQKILNGQNQNASNGNLNRIVC